MYTLTKEQEDIIQAVHNDEKVIKVQAYAGCAKTSTLIEVAKEIRKTDKKSKILYTVFNRCLIEDAKKKFGELKLDVDCRTVHSLGLKYFRGYMLKKTPIVVSGFSPSDVFDVIKKCKEEKKIYTFPSVTTVMEVLDIYLTTDTTRYNFLQYLFEHSNAEEIEDINSDIITAAFAVIDSYKKKNTYTHGMYLKEIACYNTETLRGYDYIFVDECQDINVLLYKMLQRMTYKKIFVVGDTFQTIYSFLNTLNLFELMEGKVYPLTKSFRLTNFETDLSDKLLKGCYGKFYKYPITNNGDKEGPYDMKNVSVLFRTNANMFMFAVTLLKKGGNVKVNFINSANNGNKGTFDTEYKDMIYFFHQLLLAQRRFREANKLKELFKVPTKSKLVDNLLKLCKESGSNFFDYCNTTSLLSFDLERYFMVYKAEMDDIIGILSLIKKSETNKKPDRVFNLATVHRYKGLESDLVILAPDKWRIKNKEDINLMYVACTRAKRHLDASSVREAILTFIKSGFSESIETYAPTYKDMDRVVDVLLYKFKKEKYNRVPILYGIDELAHTCIDEDGVTHYFDNTDEFFDERF